MSASAEDAETTSGAETSDTRLPTDTALEALVNIVNDSGLELGVRFDVGGHFLSGTMISAATYFEETSEAFLRDAPDDEPTPQKFLGQEYAEIAKNLRSYIEDSTEDPDATFDIPNFIHLREALSFTSGSATPLTVGLWRIRISSVKGWGFGTYTSSTD